MAANKQNPRNLPKIVEQTARLNNLGSYSLCSRFSPLSYIGGTGKGLFWFCIGILMIAVINFSFLPQLRDLGLWGWLVLLCVIALAVWGVIVGGRSFFGGLAVLFVSRPEVYLFQQGLVVLKAGRASSYSWEQVKAIWRDVRDYTITTTTTYGRRFLSNPIKQSETSYGRTHYYLFLYHDGRKLVLDDHLQGIEELGEQAFEQASRTLFASLKKAFTAGETASFGKLRINREGITYRQKLLPWQQVRRCEVGSEFFVIWAHGEGVWAQLRLKEVPNAAIFLSLVNDVFNETQ